MLKLGRLDAAHIGVEDREHQDGPAAPSCATWQGGSSRSPTAPIEASRPSRLRDPHDRPAVAADGSSAGGHARTISGSTPLIPGPYRALHGATSEAELLLACDQPSVRVQDIRRDSFGEDAVIVQLFNVSDQPAETRLRSGRRVAEATGCRPLGTPTDEPISMPDDHSIVVPVKPLETVHVRLSLAPATTPLIRAG